MSFFKLKISVYACYFCGTSHSSVVNIISSCGQMIYEDPVTDVNIEKQTLQTQSGKLLKYGSLIIATGCTASRYSVILGGPL